MNKIKADVGVVHGAGLSMSGETIIASSSSVAQAIAGERLLQDGAVDSLLLCGLGLPCEARNVSEAAAMRDVLIARGIPDDKLTLEDRSHSTLGNWAYGAMIMQDLCVERVVGVSRPASLPRSYICGRFITNKSGIDLAGYVTSNERIKPSSLVRETMSIAILGHFLAKHNSVDVEELPELYEDFKNQYFINKLKNYRYRSSQQQ